MKNRKKLIAILLAATIAYPNLIVYGDSTNMNNNSISSQQESNIDSSEEEYNEELDNQVSDVENGQAPEKEPVLEENKATEDVTNETTPEVNVDSNTEILPEENDSDIVKETEEVNAYGIKKGAIYDKVKFGEVTPRSYRVAREAQQLSPEAIEKRQAILDYEFLVPMTDAEFEIALAYEDGNYAYVNSCDTIDEAINEVEQLRNDYDNYSIIPVAISNDGQVTYSTNSMGRMLQHRNGIPQYNAVSTTNIYKEASMSNAYTYISMDYVDDLPIIEDNGISAKVRVNGYDGWINRDVTSGNFEMMVLPINQVSNPSFYYVQNGMLYHYITTNMIGASVGVNDTLGNRIRLGVAPNYLSANTKYYSYDGNYFYTGNSTLEGLNKLVNDLKAGTTAGAVNPNNPHYNYFQYLPFRTRTNYSADELDRFINENTVDWSKLRGIGSSLIEAQEKYGVNPLVALGVAINESNWGKSDISQQKNNLFGLKAYDSSPGQSADTFATPGDSVIEFAKNYISRGYADPADWRYYGGYVGNKALGANVKYASDPFWGEKASRHAFTVDLYMSGNNINSLRDYNGYQLAKFNGTSEVRNASGTLLYGVAPSVVTTGKGAFKDNIVALKFTDGTSSGTYQIFSERNTSIGVGGSNNKYHGSYDWNDSGYVSTGALQVINTPKNCFIPGYDREDVTKNGAVENTDLNDVAAGYNLQNGNDGYKGYKDINEDGIIDVFDLVKISKKLN